MELTVQVLSVKSNEEVTFETHKATGVTFHTKRKFEEHVPCLTTT